MSETVQPWRFKWTNFRGYEESGEIEFPAMTLLIGRNNVGKTSSYSPLLLLRQTLQAQNLSTALLFRGDSVDFGTFRDVVTDHDVDREISMRLDFGAFDRRWLRGEGRNPRVLELAFRTVDGNTAELSRSVVWDEDGSKIVSRVRRTVDSFQVTSKLLPKASEGGRPIREISQLRRSLTNENPHNFFFDAVGALRLPPKLRQQEDRWSKVQPWLRASNELFDIYYGINREVRDSLLGISYIGPLRSSPKRSYLLSAETPSDVGRDGEWASEMLYQSSKDDDSTVLEETNEWLGRLGYGILSFESLGDYFQVHLRKSDSDVSINLADCGAGLSQLLPLLVQGCVMADGDTLIAQQPEIHLNPGQQDVMTDFLIELCQAGKRVIIETHSEHVLGRLRRRIAEGATLESNDVALYFSESSGNRSSLRRIGIGELGQVDNQEWPTGFFGEQLENSMKMAIAQARRKRASATSPAAVPTDD